MITIIYCRDGLAINDFTINTFVDQIISMGTWTYHISTWDVITEIRLRIKLGKISHHDISLKIEDLDGKLEDVPLSEDGLMLKWVSSMSMNTKRLLDII